MGIKKHNNVAVEFTNVVENDEFKKLEELYENDIKIIHVNGLFITKDYGYGQGCFINSDEYNVSLPNNMTQTVQNILEDNDAIDEINSGVVIAEIYSYTMKKYKGRKFYNVKFNTTF